MKADTLRLFFALPCPDDLAQRICAWRDAQGIAGAAVPAANLHMTLAFLGSQPADRLDALRRLGAGIRARPFDLQLNQAGLIGDGHACLEPATAPEALLQLVAALNQGLRALGIEPDSRPFRPHLTLLRNATGLAASPPALNWSVRAFGLYASRSQGAGVHYEALSRWRLSPAR